MRIRIICRYRENRGDGYLYLSSGKYYFPEEYWFDYPCYVIDMWLSELIIFFRNMEKPTILPFMDGRYYIKLSRNPNNTFTLSFCSFTTVHLDKTVETKENIEKEVLMSEADFRYFCKQVVLFAKNTIRQLQNTDIAGKSGQVQTLSLKLNSFIKGLDTHETRWSEGQGDGSVVPE